MSHNCYIFKIAYVQKHASKYAFNNSHYVYVFYNSQYYRNTGIMSSFPRHFHDIYQNYAPKKNTRVNYMIPIE